ncbi:MAG TPA: glycosyltransferase family 1 protein [Aggregatilineaceae bacterium]|nr:glycosyltransferase family 1 protein [Aggregatilineaceae bacterium]
MRIGFDTTALAVSKSGVGVYTENLLSHLPQVCSPEDRIVPLTHHRVPHRRVNKTLWMQALLPYSLRHDPVDVCHFTNNVAPLWTPCPTVLTIHDMTLWLYPQHHYRKRLLAMRPFIPIAARRARAIIAVSESAKNDIVRILGVPADKVHVVYSAPSDQFRRLPLESANAVRCQYNLPERFILYVGTIEPRKNLVRLLEALASLSPRPPALVIVGPRGWKDDEVFAAVEQLGLQRSVRYLGYVPLSDLIALYNLASVFAFPSLYEGCGLPVLEAMACGTPIVTSRRGGLAEMAGDAAEFVVPTSVSSIADGLHRVLRDPDRQTELRERGYVQAGQFSWRTTALQTRRVYALAELTAPAPIRKQIENW